MTEETSSRDLAEFLRSLRAVRRFAPTPVPEEVVRSILEVGRWTGSSKNTQPWELLVVDDRATLRELATCGQFAGHLAGATFAILLLMESAAAAFDAGRLAERLMLAAWAFGVGSCIGTLWPEANEARAKALLGVPLDRCVRTAISFGYPADAAATQVSRSLPRLASALPSLGRKPLGALVHSGRYGQSAASAAPRQ